jgi:hypothetical protein
MNTAAQPKNSTLWSRLLNWIKPHEPVVSELRFEKKFMIPIHELPAFEMQLARYACSPIHKPRWINNLYADTHGYEHLNENIEGLSERKKLRFRWYGKQHGEINVTAEFKIKVDDTNTKKSLKLGKINFPREMELNTLFELCIERWSHNPEGHDLMPPAGYRAALLNRYRRQYYMNANATIRITIDTPILYQNAATGICAEQHKFAIVELKCPKSHIIYSDLLPYQLSKSSKYVEGLQITDPLFEKESL